MTLMRPHAVVVAHRERMLGEGLAAVLATHPGILVVAVVTTGADLMSVTAPVDAAAVDAQLADAASLAARLRRRGTRVVMLGRCHADEDGCWVPMDASAAHLAAELVPGRQTHEPASILHLLTRREREILELVACGLAGKQVARQLGISPKTVEQHKTRIFSKLGVPNQTAAVTMMLRAGTPVVAAAVAAGSPHG